MQYIFNYYILGCIPIIIIYLFNLVFYLFEINSLRNYHPLILQFFNDALELLINALVGLYLKYLVIEQ